MDRIKETFLDILDRMYYEKSSECVYSDPDTTLSQLGVDSLDTVELDMVLEEEFGIDIVDASPSLLSPDMKVLHAISIIEELITHD